MQSTSERKIQSHTTTSIAYTTPYSTKPILLKNSENFYEQYVVSELILLEETVAFAFGCNCTQVT